MGVLLLPVAHSLGGCQDAHVPTPTDGQRGGVGHDGLDTHCTPRGPTNFKHEALTSPYRAFGCKSEASTGGARSPSQSWRRKPISYGGTRCSCLCRPV